MEIPTPPEFTNACKNCSAQPNFDCMDEIGDRYGTCSSCGATCFAFGAVVLNGRAAMPEENLRYLRESRHAYKRYARNLLSYVTTITVAAGVWFLFVTHATWRGPLMPWMELWAIAIVGLVIGGIVLREFRMLWKEFNRVYRAECGYETDWRG